MNAHDSQSLSDYHSAGKRRARKITRKIVTRPLLHTVVKPEVSGKDNVADLTGAFIVVGNHSSHLDAPMVFSLLPEHLTENLATGAAADYFYRKKTISKLTSLFFNTYPVERSGKKRSTHSSAAAGMTGRLLREGIPILIFPEGTRSRDGEVGEFKSGAAALSIKLNVPIVPLAMTGGREAMPVGNVWPKFGHHPVQLFIGKPMFANENETPQDFISRVRTQIQAMLTQQTANPIV